MKSVGARSTMTNVPDLFGTCSPKKASQLYQLYLTRLMRNRRWSRIVEACRQIRSYASRAGRPRRADFSYHFEIDALCQLGKFSAAWRQLRRLERIAYGRSINLNAKSWRTHELDWFLRYHPQILYFLGRQRLARRLFEATLAKVFRPSHDSSYQLLPYVYNSDPRPRYRQRVTLFHIYAALGKSLAEWQGWSRFVDGLHPKLVTLAGVEKQKLMRDPTLLRSLDNGTEAELKRRLTAGVSYDERDLTDPRERVRRRQRAVAKKIGNLSRADSEQQMQLESLFPELKTLPKRFRVGHRPVVFQGARKFQPNSSTTLGSVQPTLKTYAVNPACLWERPTRKPRCTSSLV
jgi:hypothetical protein